MNPRKTELARRLAEVRQRIAEAAGRSGRPVNAVTLVAVTKTVEADVAILWTASDCFWQWMPRRSRKTLRLMCSSK